MRIFAALSIVLVFTACQPATEEEPAAVQAPREAEGPSASSEALAAVLASKDDEHKARYPFRHPQETLEFVGIEPGMTVVEGLPGRGWYTKILAPYLGSDGLLIGANYPIDLWPLFPFGTDEFVATMRTWTTDFPNDASAWAGEDGADIEAFEFGAMPEELKGSADVVFFARVLHNLARFQNAGDGDFLAAAIVDAHSVLKPGGVLGVVQHHARDDMSDAFADGSRGYLKKAWLIEQIENAGFEFVAESDMNANPKDMPGEDDIVWRLPPSYRGSEEDSELKAAVDAIGESNRMTLKFVKPK